jgi:hypothetical protein
MKKILLGSIMLLTTATTNAQVDNNPTIFNIDRGGVINVIPKPLSYDGTNRVYVFNSDKQVTIYSNDFTPIKSFNMIMGMENGLGFIDYDSDHHLNENLFIGEYPCLTQTLFNEDEKYEYLSFPSARTDKWGDYNIPVCNSFNVMSEDGSILQSVTFPDGYELSELVHAQIIKLNEEYYILIADYNKEVFHVYKINRKDTTAVEQVCAPIKVGAFPNLANRNQMITIQLSGENAGNNPTNLQVVDMQGKVLNQQTIPAGQTNTTIPAHRLSNGMNLIKITQGSKTIGTEKVIIK